MTLVSNASSAELCEKRTSKSISFLNKDCLLGQPLPLEFFLPCRRAGTLANIPLGVSKRMAFSRCCPRKIEIPSIFSSFSCFISLALLGWQRKKATTFINSTEGQASEDWLFFFVNKEQICGNIVVPKIKTWLLFPIRNLFPNSLIEFQYGGSSTNVC